MNDRKQWIPRLVCLALTLGLLGLYQSHAQVWAKNRSDNQAAVDAANAHNQEVLAERPPGRPHKAAPLLGRKPLAPIRTAAIPPRPRALEATSPSPSPSRAAILRTSA